MITLEWSHPHLGCVTEVVCPVHEREVRAALRVLGIGHSGSPHGSTCMRCALPATADKAREILRARFGDGA